MDANETGLAARTFPRDAKRDAEIDDACLPNTVAAMLSELLSALRDGGGVSVVVAANGSGKSMIAAAFARRLENVAQTALLVQPTSSVSAIARDALAQLDPDDFDFTMEEDWVRALRANVLRRSRAGRPTAILIDDAHRLSPQTLDDLADLFDAEDERVRLHVFLFGRQRLLDRMQAGAEGALHSHLRKICRLEPLGVRESVRYLERRLAMGGGELTALFTDEAIDEVVQKAGGRLVVLEEVAARALHRAGKRGADRAVAEDVRMIAPRTVVEEEEGMARQQQPLRFQLTDEVEGDLEDEGWAAEDDDETVEWGDDDDEEEEQDANDGQDEWQAEDEAAIDEPALSWEASPHRLDDDHEDDDELFASPARAARPAGRRRNVGRAVLSATACLGLVWAANHLPGPGTDVRHGRDSMLFAEPLSSRPDQIMRLATTMEAADADAQVTAWKAQPVRTAAATLPTRENSRSGDATVAAAPAEGAVRALMAEEKTGKVPAGSSTTADAMGPERPASGASGQRETATGRQLAKKPVDQRLAAAPAAASRPASASTPGKSTAASVRGGAASVYTVQLGAFKTRSNAEELATRLRGKPTKILREGGLYRVMSGSFASKRDAFVHEALLRRAGYTTFVRTAVF